MTASLAILAELAVIISLQREYYRRNTATRRGSVSGGVRSLEGL
jgi:hypothetical protein